MILTQPWKYLGTSLFKSGCTGARFRSNEGTQHDETRYYKARTQSKEDQKKGEEIYCKPSIRYLNFSSQLSFIGASRCLKFIQLSPSAERRPEWCVVSGLSIPYFVLDCAKLFLKGL